MGGNYGVPLGTGLMEIIKRGETVMQIHAVSVLSLRPDLGLIYKAYFLSNIIQVN